MRREDEAVMPPDMVQRVLDQADAGVILVGGQALAFWMERYGIRQQGGVPPAISRDVDFFTVDAGNDGPLRRFARAIGGRAYVTPDHGLSALVGSAVAVAGEGRVYNVDLVHKVVGLERSQVDGNAVAFHFEDGRILRVLHPIDVLRSRNANLHELPEKQDEPGKFQLRFAIDVARAYLEERIDTIWREHAGDAKRADREALDTIADVTDCAKEDAARKNAARHGIFIADAVPAWRIVSPAFWDRQWPHLRDLMSSRHAAECEHRAGRDRAS